MAANQTIIQAVKAAYAHHEVDYRPIIQSMANASQTLANMQEDASKRLNELNKEFNAIDFIGQGQLKKWAHGIRSDKSLTHAEKLVALQDISNSMGVMETWSKEVGELYNDDGAEISGIMGGDIRSWHTSVITGKFYGPNSVQDQNNDGTISEEEFKLKPVDYIDGKMKILNYDGTYVTVDQLEGNFPKKSDSDKLYNSLERSYKKISGTVTASDIDLEVLERSDILKNRILSNPSEFKSFIFDKPIRIDGGETVTFAEYYLQEYPTDIHEDNVKIAAILVKLKEEGLTPKAQEILQNELYKQIAAADNINEKEELLKFMQKSIQYSLDTKHGITR